MSPIGSLPFGSAPFGGGPFGAGPQPGAPDGLALRIGPNADGIKYLFYRSWRIREQLNGRNTVSCTLLAADGFSPVIGQDFILTLNQTRIFAGSIFARRARFLTEGRNDWIEIDVECVDWNRVCDRRKIAEVYENKTLGFIVRDVVAQTIGQEGISDAGVEDGPTLAKVVFPNLSVADAFNQLSEATGYYWNIDYFKTLHFFQRQTSLAPFAIVNGVNATFRKFSEEQSLAQYRNSEFVDGGKGITVQRREVIPADGTTRTFTLEYPVAEVPQLDLNGVVVQPDQVGIRGVEENKKFYWAKGSNTIGHDQNETVLPATDQVGVTYRGLFDIATEIIDFAKVAERQAIEGGTGLYEHVHVENSLDGEEVVLEKGLALLNKYGLSSDVEFELDAPGLAIGQQVSVTVPELGISNTLYLITELETRNLVLNERRFSVRASTGELKGTFTEFWKRLFARNPITIREDEVVQSALPLVDGTTLTDDLVATLADAVPTEWGTGVMGEGEWG